MSTARGSSATPPTWSSPACSAASIPAGVTQAQAVQGLRERGEDKLADMLATMDHVVPGQGVDFDAVGDVLLLGARGVRRGVAARPGCRATSSTTSCRTPSAGCAQDVEDKINPLPLELLRQVSRAASC